MRRNWKKWKEGNYNQDILYGKRIFSEKENNKKEKKSSRQKVRKHNKNLRNKP